MKSLVLALALGICGVAMADEPTVIVPLDDQPFTVEKSNIVRLTGTGVADSKIEANVEGPAKVESTSTIKRLRNGERITGSYVKEFDLKPTDTGKVTVTITVTSPKSKAKPKVKKFAFEVK